MNWSRNPYFIGINSAIVISVQNANYIYPVAILILLELTLQYAPCMQYHMPYNCRNPYFIGINSAIGDIENVREHKKPSQSLFYWN